MATNSVSTAERNSGKRHRWPHRWTDIDPARRGLVLSWTAFTVTFIVARIVTGVIKIASGSTGNVNSGSLHLHHFLWGILLVSGVAILGLTDRSERSRARMGIALGIGLGLIVDEAALLVTLKDVYWKSAGWSSIGAAIVIISVAGTALVVTRSGKYEETDDTIQYRPPAEEVVGDQVNRDRPVAQSEKLVVAHEAMSAGHLKRDHDSGRPA